MKVDGRNEIDARVESFEAARDRDDSAPIEAFLPDPDHPQFLAVLCELVRVDLELRWGQGDRPTLGEYRDRFPALFAVPERCEEVTFEYDRLQRQPVSVRRAVPASRISRRVGPAEDDAIARLEASNPALADRLARVETRWPEVGQWFVGFHLDVELGRGAFGRVYRARQGDLADRPVALKVAPNLTGESRMLAQLQHTNVVPIYSMHRAGLFDAVCMPYLGSVTLADVIADLGRHDSLPDSGAGLLVASRSGPDAAEPASQPTSERPAPSGVARLRALGYAEAVLSIGVKLTEGLAHAHERGIIHRDLKPANILFADDGEPMLLDFNLAIETAPDHDPTVAMVGGTLPYMAPEQIRAFRGDGSAVDGRADLYALGVILFELLAGRPPFPIRRGPIDRVLGEMLADRAGPPPSCRAANPAVSPAESAIVARLLEPDAARRYQTAGDLREDLQRHLDRLPLRHAREPSWRERTRKWTRRHPRLSSSTSVALLALVLVAGLVGGLWSRQRRVARLEATTAAHQLDADLGRAEVALASRAVVDELGDEGLALCRRVAARFGADGPPSWLDGPLVADLDAPDRTRVRQQLGDLLLIAARSLAWRADRTTAPARAGRLAEANRLLDQAAMAYGPGSSPRALLTVRADLARRAGDPAGQARWLAAAAKVPLRTPREFLLEVEEQIGRGRFEEVRSRLLDSGRSGSDDVRVALLLAEGYADRGRYDEARRHLDLVVTLRPDWPWSILRRGKLELDAHRPVAAEADFDRVLRLRPGLVPALVNRALARLARPEPDPAGAIADLSDALSRPGVPTRAWFIRATARERAGDMEGARRDREHGLRQTPTDPVSWVARGVERLPTDPQGALADIDEALRLDPRYLVALQNRAAILAEPLNRPDEAIALFDHAIGLHPGSVDARTGRGILLARAERRDAAHADARAALMLDQGPETLYRTSGIYARTAAAHPEDSREALRLLAAAIGREPSWLAVVSTDPDLDPIRAHPDFRAMIAALAPLARTEPARVQ